MKVTLDLDALLAEGSIDRAEYDKLAALSSRGTASLAFSLLVGFAIVAISLGVIALVPDAVTGLVVGAALLAAGLALYAMRPGEWEILAHIFVLVGALTLAGGAIVLTDASIAGMLVIAAGFAVLGVIAQSGLLVILSALALSSSIGARTGYMHATYLLGIKEPTATIVLFAIVALATFLLSKRLPAAWSRLAILAARTSIFLVNFGFWIGSLWGDSFAVGAAMPGLPWTSYADGQLSVDRQVYVVLWAAALLAVALWGARVDRRWVVTVATVFGIIHFYTQWFEWLGPHPLSIFLAGLVTLVVALALWRFNRALWPGRHQAAG